MLCSGPPLLTNEAAPKRARRLIDFLYDLGVDEDLQRGRAQTSAEIGTVEVPRAMSSPNSVASGQHLRSIQGTRTRLSPP